MRGESWAELDSRLLSCGSGSIAGWRICSAEVKLYFSWQWKLRNMVVASTNGCGTSLAALVVPRSNAQQCSSDACLDVSPLPQQGAVEALDLPVPLTPFSSDYARSVELERAMVAEAAMQSNEGVSKQHIVYEDEWFIVFNKPSGIYSEHVLATVKSMLRDGDLETREQAEDSQPFAHMVNRLDRDTSGVLVVAKCKDACGKLANMFTKRQVEKAYVARCAGRLPDWTDMQIESGHGRSRFGAWRVYSVHDIGRKLPGRGGSSIKDMKTIFQVIGPRAPALVSSFEALKLESGIQDSRVQARKLLVVGNDMTEDATENDDKPAGDVEIILRASPLTGRTHQIRLHCCYLGMPLIGDVKYGGPHEWDGSKYDAHCLHAERLSFKHPITKQPLLIVAPHPNWTPKEMF